MSAEMPPAVKAMQADLIALFAKWDKLPGVDGGQVVGVLLGCACAFAAQLGFTIDEVLDQVAKLMVTK